MRRLSIVLLLLATTTLSCGLLKKKKAADDDDDNSNTNSVADAATVTVSGTGAKNESSVLRYAKEDKVADELAAIAKDGTIVRTYPGLGAVVATLARGTPVVKIAKYFSTGVLITFDDLDGGKLMGWVAPEQLVAPGTVTPSTSGAKPTIVHVGDGGIVTHDAGAAPSTPVSPTTLYIALGADGKCPGGFAAINGGCRRTCTADSNCPAHTFCIGSSKKYCSTTK